MGPVLQHARRFASLPADLVRNFKAAACGIKDLKVERRSFHFHLLPDGQIGRVHRASIVFEVAEIVVRRDPPPAPSALRSLRPYSSERIRNWDTPPGAIV